jgi:hypothetical protein
MNIDKAYRFGGRTIKRIVETKLTEDFKDGHLAHRKTEKKEYVPER